MSFLMTTIHVNLGDRGYDIVVASAGFAQLTALARRRCRGSFAFVVTDEHAHVHARPAARALEEAGFQTVMEVLPAGEVHKSLASASHLYDQLAELRADRQTVVVAVGGGVIGDLAGVVAATYAR